MKNGRCKGNNQLCRVAKEDIEKWFDETLKPIDLMDVCPQQSVFDNSFFVITDNDIEALNRKGLICKGRVWCFPEV